MYRLPQASLTDDEFDVITFMRTFNIMAISIISQFIDKKPAILETDFSHVATIVFD